MLLACDVGNSNITLGLFEETLLHSENIPQNHQSAEMLGQQLRAFCQRCAVDPKRISDAIFASVVPSLSPMVQTALNTIFQVRTLEVQHTMKMPVRIKRARPETLGLDRLANAVAAFENYPCPALIVDFGTATTYDLLDADGNLCAGLIAPGIEVSADALYSQAERLQKTRLIPPASIISTETSESIHAGIIYSAVGACEYIAKRFQKELQLDTLTVIATGGLCSLVARETACIQAVNPFLTLEGLQILYHFNRKDNEH